MRRIYKYPLITTDAQLIELPVGSSVLSVIDQNDCIMLYALVDDEVVEKQPYKISIHGTGHNAYEATPGEFVGTVVLYDNALVFHVFARGLCC